MFQDRFKSAVRTSRSVEVEAPDGTRTVLATTGLVYPTGLAVGNGSIYISNYGVYPGRGNPNGQVVSLPASLAG